eukprot:tig00000142_g8647.t1
MSSSSSRGRKRPASAAEDEGGGSDAELEPTPLALLQLPDRLLEIVVAQLNDYEILVNVALVCARLRRIALSRAVWERHTLSLLPPGVDAPRSLRFADLLALAARFEDSAAIKIVSLERFRAPASVAEAARFHSLFPQLEELRFGEDPAPVPSNAQLPTAALISNARALRRVVGCPQAGAVAQALVARRSELEALVAPPETVRAVLARSSALARLERLAVSLRSCLPRLACLDVALPHWGDTGRLPPLPELCAALPSLRVLRIRGGAWGSALGRGGAEGPPPVVELGPGLERLEELCIGGLPPGFLRPVAASVSLGPAHKARRVALEGPGFAALRAGAAGCPALEELALRVEAPGPAPSARPAAPPPRVGALRLGPRGRPAVELVECPAVERAALRGVARLAAGPGRPSPASPATPPPPPPPRARAGAAPGGPALADSLLPRALLGPFGFPALTSLALEDVHFEGPPYPVALRIASPALRRLRLAGLSAAPSLPEAPSLLALDCPALRELEVCAGDEPGRPPAPRAADEGSHAPVLLARPSPASAAGPPRGPFWTRAPSSGAWSSAAPPSAPSAFPAPPTSPAPPSSPPSPPPAPPRAPRARRLPPARAPRAARGPRLESLAVLAAGGLRELAVVACPRLERVSAEACLALARLSAEACPRLAAVRASAQLVVLAPGRGPGARPCGALVQALHPRCAVLRPAAGSVADCCAPPAPAHLVELD